MKTDQDSIYDWTRDARWFNKNVFSSALAIGTLLIMTVLTVPFSEASGKAKTTTQSETIQVNAGKTITRRFAKNPQHEIRAVRLFSTMANKPVPRKWARVSLSMRSRYVEVTIATTSEIPPGEYRLELLDSKGRPIESKDHPAMIAVHVLPVSHVRTVSPPAIEHTGPSRHSTKAGPGAMGVQERAHPRDKPQITSTSIATQQSRMRDAVRGEGRAGRVSERLGQIDSTSRVGSQLLFGFGQTLRDTITAHLGGWPGDNWQGVLGADISTFRDRSTSSITKTPSRPDKSTSDIHTGFRPDSRLMTGDGEGDDSGSGDGGDQGDGSGTTDSGGGDGSDQGKTDSAGDDSSKDKNDNNDRVDNITTSDSDEESSDGSSSQSSTVTNSSSDGSTFSHTVTSKRDKNGNRTETQSVNYTDKNGNKTTYRSVSSGGNTTTSCSGALCTPHPDSADCTGSGCDNFRGFVDGFMYLSQMYVIRSKQSDSESAMQPDGPGSGKRRAGFERPSSRDVIKQRISRHILPIDGESTSQGAGASGPSGSRPRQDPDTLVNPQEPGKESGTPVNPKGQ